MRALSARCWVRCPVKNDCTNAAKLGGAAGSSIVELPGMLGVGETLELGTGQGINSGTPVRCQSVLEILR